MHRPRTCSRQRQPFATAQAKVDGTNLVYTVDRVPRQGQKRPPWQHPKCPLGSACFRRLGHLWARLAAPGGPPLPEGRETTCDWPPSHGLRGLQRAASETTAADPFASVPLLQAPCVNANEAAGYLSQPPVVSLGGGAPCAGCGDGCDDPSAQRLTSVVYAAAALKAAGANVLVGCTYVRGGHSNLRPGPCTGCTRSTKRLLVPVHGMHS